MGVDQYVNPAVILAAATFIAKQLWDLVTNSQRDLKNSIDQLTLATHRLTVKLEFLEKKLEPIPQLKKDIDALASKVRTLSS